MSLTAQLLALVRRGSRSSFSDGTYQAEINSGGDLLVAQALPLHAELTRLGTRWSLAIATGSGFTFGAAPAWPTTGAQLVLYNGEATGGKSYIIDTIWGACATVSIGTATPLLMLAQISNAGVAAPSQDTAQLITGTSGKIYAGAAKRAVANTAFAIASKWSVVGGSGPHPATAIGAGVFCEVLGRYIIVPGACLCLNLVSGVNLGTGIVGCDWYEVQLDIGA